MGLLLPFSSKEDLDFFTHLELFLRDAGGVALSPLGRDHLSYRGYYVPVKHVIDGDLCEMFQALKADKQAALAADLDRTPVEVMRKLEDFRNKVM